MPSATTIKQLVQDLRERKSQISRKFDSCNDKCKADSAYRTNILNLIKPQNWDPNTQPLPAGMVSELGLTPKEVAHIEAWPQKALVRDTIVQAITPDLPRDMAFFWDLNDDPNATTSITDFDDQGAPAPIKVTFLTRRDQVTKPGYTYGDVKLGT